MAERSICDLSHFSMHVHDIGRLGCLARIPVLAGDSFEMNSQLLFRLNQLRRPMSLDVKIDVFLFYCPYRFAYGQSWINYIEDGGKTPMTFPTLSKSYAPHWLHVNTTTFPAHIWRDAINIYNQHFKDPSESDIIADAYDPGYAVQLHGLPAWHLKTWGSAQAKKANLADTDYQHTVVGNKITMFDLQSLASKGRNRSYRAFISSRYREIMGDMAEAELHNYADNVPELVWRESQWMSGYDINGTSGADLGVAVGKGIGTVNFNMPRRFFAEHGTLYMFALLRIPPVYEYSRHYLDTFNRPYHQIVPQEGNEFAPVELSAADFFTGGSAAEKMGYVPMWEWYRTHPSMVHPTFFNQDTGWQTLDRPANWNIASRVNPSSYDSMFQTLKLRHAASISQHNITAYRPIPGPMGSVMGTV